MSAAVPEQLAQPPSAKALGKRPAAPLDSPAAAAAAAPASSAPVVKVKEREKRVTRSSLGGNGSGAGPLSREGSATASEALAPPLYLPATTPILLCLVPPSEGLTHHPPLLLPADALTAAEDDSKLTEDPDKPPFRLLAHGDAFGRSRHAGATEVDTSDAFYHRLHRFPEVLEKRSARLERERLIHERSKLINELEELRGRGWVYQGAQGGKGEEERRRRIKEGEDRLKRYDALLPNQPRKSNFLNNGPHQSNGVGDSHSRAGSPAVSAPAPSRSSTSHHHHRHSTPVSAASGDGSTTIKIKFVAGGRGGGGRYVQVGHGGAGASSSSHTRAGGGKGKRFSYAEPDSDEDEEDEEDYSDVEEEEDGGWGESGKNSNGTRRNSHSQPGREGKPPKRDRKAERARAEERIRLGIPPRSNKPVDISRKRRRSSREGEEEEGDWEDNDLEDDEDYTQQQPGERVARPRRIAQLQQRASKASKPLRRIRLPDSFFQTRALRDAFLATIGPSSSFSGLASSATPSTDTTAAAPSTSTRRSSSRLTYAFGQRLPDGALNRYGEFELFGGVADDESDKEPGNTRTRLEEMVVARDGEGKAEVWGGRVVPRSALEVERRGPIVMGQPHVAGQALPGIGAAEGDSSAGEPPLPPPTTRPRRRSSVSRSITNNGTTFVSARPRRPSATSGNAPLTAPAIALGWALPGPGGNESSSSITSVQTTSADESHAEGRGQAGARAAPKVGDGEAMVLDD